jgi:hypothetical protein
MNLNQKTNHTVTIENCLIAMEQFAELREHQEGWISVKDKLPEVAQFCLVTTNELQPLTDKLLNEQYKMEVKIIYYFKERNVTGWQNDWTGKQSDVKFWMPLPKPPLSQK